MKTLPEPFRDVMITYNKTYFEPYSDRQKTKIVTKRGFYSDLFNNFAVPPEYRYFNGRYLPHDFSSDHLRIDNVIDWKYCE